MRIRLVLAKTVLKDIKVDDVEEGTTPQEIRDFAKKQFPEYELVDIIYPTDEDFNIPLTKKP